MCVGEGQGGVFRFNFDFGFDDLNPRLLGPRIGTSLGELSVEATFRRHQAQRYHHFVLGICVGVSKCQHDFLFFYNI